MKQTFVTVATIALVVMIGTAGFAQTHTQPIQTAYSGTTVATEVDSNGDGIRASDGISFGQGTNGNNVSRSIDELGASVGSTAECPAPTVKVPYVASSVVVTTEDGSAYFMRLASGYSCVDTTPGSGRFTYVVNYNIIGGNGRFEGVTGAVQSAGSGRIIAVAPTGGVPPNRPTLTQFSGSSQGEMVLPN